MSLALRRSRARTDGPDGGVDNTLDEAKAALRAAWDPHL